MALHEFKRGHFTVQISRADPLEGKALRLCKRVAGLPAAQEQERSFEAQALAWFQERDLIRQARARGLRVDSPSIPGSAPDFPTYLERHYLPWFRQTHGERTLRARASAIMVLAEDLAGVRLDEVEHRVDALVEAWRNEGVRYRAEKDRLGRTQKRKPRLLTDAGLNERLRRLREVLNHAYKKTRILGTPPRIQLLTIKGAAPGAEKPLRYFLPEERVRFLRYCERDVADAFEISRMLGLRPAELFHARVDWVDFRQKKVWVQACPCALCPDGKWISKTGTFRGVDICADLLPILRRLTKGRSDDARLIANAHGAPISRLEGSGGRFARALRAAGLDRKGLSMYSTRHTFSADLITAGVPLRKVAALLGNSVRVCELHYGHLIPGQTADAVRSLRAVQPWPSPAEHATTTEPAKPSAKDQAA